MYRTATLVHELLSAAKGADKMLREGASDAAVDAVTQQCSARDGAVASLLAALREIDAMRGSITHEV